MGWVVSHDSRGYHTGASSQCGNRSLFHFLFFNRNVLDWPRQTNKVNKTFYPGRVAPWRAKEINNCGLISKNDHKIKINHLFSVPKKVFLLINFDFSHSELQSLKTQKAKHVKSFFRKKIFLIEILY